MDYTVLPNGRFKSCIRVEKVVIPRINWRISMATIKFGSSHFDKTIYALCGLGVTLAYRQM